MPPMSLMIISMVLPQIVLARLGMDHNSLAMVQCCSVVIVNVVQWASLIHVLFFFGWEEGASLDATEMFGNNAFILGGLYRPSP